MFDIIMVGPFPEDSSRIKGGVQASVYGLSLALLKRVEIHGVEVYSIPARAASGAIRSATVEGIPVTYLHTPYRLHISTIIHLPRVLRAIRRKVNPVVHIHGTGLFQAALIVSLRIRSIPFIWTVHGITEKETGQRYRERRTAGNLLRHWLYSFLERLSLRVSPFTIVDTPYVSGSLRPTGDNLYVIPQGIFTEDFADMPHGERKLPIVACLGVIHPRKGHHLTLEAFAHVKAKVPQARLVIAGTSTIAAYAEMLRKRVAELGMTDEVEILTDLTRSDVLALLGRSRLFALHSQEESQGIALCEALAAGLPVVSTRVGGIPYVVEDREDGFLIPYGDVTTFADAIILLLTDDSLHATMSARAKTASRRFNWTGIAGDVSKVYGV